jgi:carboxymethylenebutenolidase
VVHCGPLDQQFIGATMMKAKLLLIVGLLLAGCQQDDNSARRSNGIDPNDYLAATAHAHRDDEPIATPASADPVANLLEQELAYGETGSSNLIGYLAMPADAIEPLPGVIVIHEWWGLNDNVKAMTRRLAAEGFVALAVDLYSGATATTSAEAEVDGCDLIEPGRLLRFHSSPPVQRVAAHIGSLASA